MIKRSRPATEHGFVADAVEVLLEQKRGLDEAARFNASHAGKLPIRCFVLATARPELTNLMATPGSGMFSDSVDPMAPSG